MDLTGKIGYRQTLFGKIVVTVQYRGWDSATQDSDMRWRDATAADMMQLGISRLMRTD